MYIGIVSFAGSSFSVPLDLRRRVGSDWPKHSGSQSAGDVETQTS